MQGIWVFSHGAPPVFSIGRTASGQQSGNNASFAISFSPAPVAGTWIQFIGATNTATCTPAGGTNAWTLVNSSASVYFQYKHLCAAGEPTSYGVTFNGAQKSDAACGVMTEILDPNATNPDAAPAMAASTATCPSAAAAGTGEIALIGYADSTGGSVPTAPTGYTTKGSVVNTGSCTVVIAGKTGVGSGTVSPGSWSGAGGMASTTLWKP